MVVREPSDPPASVLREWMESDGNHRLVILSGAATAIDSGAGLEELYLKELLNTAAGKRVSYARDL